MIREGMAHQGYFCARVTHFFLNLRNRSQRAEFAAERMFRRHRECGLSIGGLIAGASAESAAECSNSGLGSFCNFALCASLRRAVWLSPESALKSRFDAGVAREAPVSGGELMGEICLPASVSRLRDLAPLARAAAILRAEERHGLLIGILKGSAGRWAAGVRGSDEGEGDGGSGNALE